MVSHTPMSSLPRSHAASDKAVLGGGIPNSRIDELLPWAYPVTSALKDVA